MAEIDNHVCGRGALVDLDDLAFELVTRTELHHFLRHNRRRFSQPQSGRHSIRCDATGPQDGSSPRRGLTAGNLWRGDAGGLLCRPQRLLDRRCSIGSCGRYGHWRQRSAAKSHVAAAQSRSSLWHFAAFMVVVGVSHNTRGRQWRTLAYPSVWTSPTATASAPARSRSWRRYASRDRSPPRHGILVCRIGVPGFSSNRSTKACPRLPSPPRPEGPAAEAPPLTRPACR